MKLDRHLEGVHILAHLSDDAEPLSLPQAIDGVLLSELWRFSRLHPLDEERLEVASARLFRHFLEIPADDRLPGEFLSELGQQVLESLLPDDPTQHVEDHHALGAGQGIELG